MKTLIANCGEIAHLSYGEIDKAISGFEMKDRDILVYPKGFGILIDNDIVVSPYNDTN